MTASTVPFLVTTSDNVGIGAVTPNEQLEITGNFRRPATTGIIMSGADRFIHNFGLENFFAGVNTGNLTMTGFGNVGVGEAALYSNTAGFDNADTGISALEANTTGVHNTATGQGSLEGNTTGGDNTAIGSLALQSNTTGNNNTATGVSNKIQLGNDNVAGSLYICIDSGSVSKLG